MALCLTSKPDEPTEDANSKRIMESLTPPPITPTILASAPFSAIGIQRQNMEAGRGPKIYMIQPERQCSKHREPELVPIMQLNSSYNMRHQWSSLVSLRSPATMFRPRAHNPLLPTCVASCEPHCSALFRAELNFNLTFSQ